VGQVISEWLEVAQHEDSTRGRYDQLIRGDHLPTVTELAATYGVSAGTAHRAIDLLRSQGAITVSRGRRAQAISPETT
jgi:DNA-binding GntR family transcriptional regulator